ncbi:MAG: hypothetical protein ACJ76V_01145 [Thermoleophilaceae bacterium]
MRRGPKVVREKHESLADALDSMRTRAQELSETADAHTLDTKLGKKFEPVQQVVGRIELRGPGVPRSGIDVRGDGSTESYTGWVRRELIEQRDGEDAYEALRRRIG